MVPDRNLIDLTTISVFDSGDHVRELRIDVPDDPLNLVTPELHEDLLEALRYLRQDVTARAIIISAEGKAFSGGGHMKKMFGQYENIDSAMAHHQRAREITSQLLDQTAVVISAVRGAAVGLGASVALFSDFLVMSDSARLIDPHVRAGLVAGDGGTIAFPAAMSLQQTKKHLILGRPLTAADALAAGIAYSVVPDDLLDSAAWELASEVAALPPLAVRHTKLAVNAHLKNAALFAMDTAAAWEHVAFRTEDHREAISAFLEKRPGNFTGR